MQLIKKILAWLISLFHMIFPKKNKKTNKKNIDNNINIKTTSKEKSIVTEINETMPGYMYLSNYEKTLLINQIKEVKKVLQEKSDEYINQEIKEIFSIIDNLDSKDNTKLKEVVTDFKNNLSKGINKSTNKVLNELVNMISVNEKETIIVKYDSICNNKKIIRENINKVDTIINEVEKKDITIIEKNSIIEVSDNALNNKNDNIVDNIENYNEDMLRVMKNVNKNIIDKVNLEYKKVNYITLTTELLDEISDKLKKVEDNYSKHRFNKYYYEREISKIKKQILELKDLKSKPQVYNEILKLRKELYTKSKDKYDILYNNEAFLNINQKCDELINKVNAKVVDIKKEKEQAKKEKSKKQNEYIKNILLRFQDMALARHIIMDMAQVKFENDKEMILYIKNMYDGFTTNGINDKFNFKRNKEKTELVVLFNSLNKVNCHLKKEQYIPIEHINFRMNDLLDAVVVKKEELGTTMKNKYNIDITNKLVDDKMDKLLTNGVNNKPKVLTKKIKKEE